MKKTRQRITLVLLTAMIALLFTGCVKLDTSITIKKDGRIDLDIIYAVLEDYYDSEITISDENKSMLAAAGITCSDYYEDGYAGIRLTGENIKLSTDFDDAFSDVFDFDGNFLSYSIDGNRVSVTALQDDSYTGGSYSKEYGSMISMSGASAQIRITFPEGTNVIDNNATSVSYDGLTYTWDLLQLDFRDGLRVDFEMPMGATVPLLYAIIGGAVGAVVIVVILVVILIKYNKKQKAEAAARMCAENNNKNAAYIPTQISSQNLPQNTEPMQNPQSTAQSEENQNNQP